MITVLSDNLCNLVRWKVRPVMKDWEATSEDRLDLINDAYGPIVKRWLKNRIATLHLIHAELIWINWLQRKRWIQKRVKHWNIISIKDNACNWFYIDAKQNRLEMLKKWKAEKELKKKKEQEERAKHKPFRVSKVTTSQLQPVKPSRAQVIIVVTFYEFFGVRNYCTVM